MPRLRLCLICFFSVSVPHPGLRRTVLLLLLPFHFYFLTSPAIIVDFFPAFLFEQLMITSLHDPTYRRAPRQRAMGRSPPGYDLPLWSEKSEGMDMLGLQIHRLIQACCSGSILHSRDYYLLLACPGQFDTDRNV
jgi:hypothetical protein